MQLLTQFERGLIISIVTLFLKKNHQYVLCCGYLFSKFLYVLYIDISDSQNHRLNLIKFHIRCFGSTIILLHNKYGSSKRTHRRQLEISSVDQRYDLPRVKLAPEETAEKDKQQL